MNLKCVIIDDEPLARKLLIGYCKRVPFLDLLADFSNGLEALTYLRNHQVDLIFLDIKMPDISGLDLTRAMQEKPMVIFTTAFAEYAVDAFELDAIDYLLKPFDFARFLKSADKALVTGQTQPLAQDIQRLEKDFMLVKDGRNLVKIDLKLVRFIKGQKDYVMFVMNEKKVMTLMNMRDLERKLPAHLFIRIHQSYIVNMQYVESILNDKVSIGGEYLPISQSYKLAFKIFMNK